MTEVEEEDILNFNTRMSVKKLKDGRQMGGARTYKGVLGFVRMAFQNYQRKNHKWINPFLYIDTPRYESKTRDALPEDEMLKIFEPGVLRGTMELVVGTIIFYSGLRRSEVFALKPEDLDWKTPKITVRRAWQMFDDKERVIGPPKSKKPRDTLFDPILQEAVKKLWEENGKHEYVVSYKNGKTPGPSWIRNRFSKWLERAGIELGGREIVPHSSRHTLASLLEAKGIPIRYIQEILGHSDEETTKIYLHSPEKMIREVGKKISEARKDKDEKEKEDNNIVTFKAS
jgi:integrase